MRGKDPDGDSFAGLSIVDPNLFANGPLQEVAWVVFVGGMVGHVLQIVDDVSVVVSVESVLNPADKMGAASLIIPVVEFDVSQDYDPLGLVALAEFTSFVDEPEEVHH